MAGNYPDGCTQADHDAYYGQLDADRPDWWDDRETADEPNVTEVENQCEECCS